MLDNDLISIGELLDIFSEKGLEFNNQVKMKLLSFVEDGLEPLFFYKGDISRQTYKVNIDNNNHILQKESIIDNVCGYLVLCDNDLNNLLFNGIDFLQYPISESEDYPLVGSFLPPLSNKEEYDDGCWFVRFYTIDFELSVTDVLFRKASLNKFLKWKELKKAPKTITNNNKLTTLQTQLDQAHARIAELEKVVEQSRATVTPIFDSQDSYTYPPELDMAIKIWLEIYQTDNIPKHLTNHSDKFTQACKNLGFAFTKNAIETRLKKVTTPQSQKEKTKNKNSLK